MNLISGAIGFKVGGPVGGAAAFGARIGQRVLEGGLNGIQAARSFEGGAPRVRAPLPEVPPRFVSRAAMGAGVGTGILPFGALRMPRGKIGEGRVELRRRLREMPAARLLAKILTVSS